RSWRPKDAAGLGSFRDLARPADEPRLGRRERRYTLRGKPRPLHDHPRPPARRARPVVGESSLTSDSMRLTDKIAIVTGAAHGIGKAIAALFAAEGAWVLVADVDDAAGEASVAAIRAGGGRGAFRHVDVAHEAQVATAVQQAADAGGGRVDVLGNNASYLADWPAA